MIAAALSSDARAALSSSAWFGYRPLTLATVDDHEQHDRGDPHDDAHPVAAQREPGERRGRR